MRLTAAIVLVLIVAGCAVSKETYLADGTAGHSIDCSGSALTWGDCYEKAGDLCGANGYDVITRDGEDGASLAATGGTVYGSSLMKRSMLVRCSN